MAERKSNPAAKAAQFHASVEAKLLKEGLFLTNHGWELTLRFYNGLWEEAYTKPGVTGPISALEAARLERSWIKARLEKEALERWRAKILKYKDSLLEQGIEVVVDLGPEGQQTPRAIEAAKAAKTRATWISFLERNEIPLKENDKARE